MNQVLIYINLRNPSEAKFYFVEKNKKHIKRTVLFYKPKQDSAFVKFLSIAFVNKLLYRLNCIND